MDIFFKFSKVRAISKRFINFFLRYLGYRIIRVSTELQPQEINNQDVIISSYTNIPDQEKISLPYSYKKFDWYYPYAEMQSKKWVVDNVKKNWTIIDVGANIGYYSLLFAKLAKQGTIHAIEPTTSYNLLQKNIEHHKAENIVTYDVALGKESGKFTEKIFKIWGDPPETLETEFFSLDDFVINNKINNVDLVKIDTDGYDLEILQGSKNVIEKFNPWVMIEFSYALQTRGFEVGQLIEELISQGFKQGLLLDHNNIITKREENPLSIWSNSFCILPHEYIIPEKKENLPEFVKKISRETLDQLRENIIILDPDEAFRRFDLNIKLNLFKLNARLPGRGPRMEVNDAPILKEIYTKFSKKNHLEFGTWEGFGTSLVCENSNVDVTTINIPKGELLDEKNVYTSSLYPNLRQKFTGLDPEIPSDKDSSIGWVYKALGYSDRVTQILKDSKDLSNTDFSNNFETIFIDGGHSVEAVVSDTKLSLKVLANEGAIIWHDFTLNEEELGVYESPLGVITAINQLLPEIKRQGVELFWIKDTWILIGIR